MLDIFYVRYYQSEDIFEYGIYLTSILKQGSYHTSTDKPCSNYVRI